MPASDTRAAVRVMVGADAEPFNDTLRTFETAVVVLTLLGTDLSAALGYWIAFAYWKVAIIVDGVYRRWLNDPGNGSGAGELQPAIARLAQNARAALDSNPSAVKA